MPRFPRRENEVAALARAMIAGYTANPSVFPHADLAGLTNTYDIYKSFRKGADCFMALAHMKTEAKDQALAELAEKMRVELKQSEVDTVADPEALKLIHWGERAAAQPQRKPGQPRDFEAVRQGRGTVAVDWKSPGSGPHGTVRTYVVFRRQADATGHMGPWEQAALTPDTALELTGQPTNTQLEYRVTAFNLTGPGPPSNTAGVVL